MVASRVLLAAVNRWNMLNEIWGVPIRITKITVGLDYIVVSYNIVEESYKLCSTHLRTWKAYNE